MGSGPLLPLGIVSRPSQVAFCGVVGNRRWDVRVSAGVEGGDVLWHVVVRARVLGRLGGEDEADERPVVGVDPDDVGAAADFLVDALERIR